MLDNYILVHKELTNPLVAVYLNNETYWYDPELDLDKLRFNERVDII